VAVDLETAAEAQQRDNLCGPYWGAQLLVRAGVASAAGEPVAVDVPGVASAAGEPVAVDQDLVALWAGTTLPDCEGDWVPPGASALRGYRYELPVAPPDEAGTSAPALAEVIEALAGGALRVTPLAGWWTSEKVERLVDAVTLGGGWLLANLRTGLLWGSRPHPDVLEAELRGEPQDGPPADWDAGHFVELRLLVRGPGGSLVVVGDSYPSLGWRGRHLQPPRAVAAALQRTDGHGGGVLVVSAPESSGVWARLAGDLGLEIATWDNGSRRARRERT
jgi:hypothetical protein